MNLLLENQWELFIVAEILSFLFLVAFLLCRYALERTQLGRIFFFLFLAITAGEGLLAWIVYQQTGQIETFQMVVLIFILYACTFGISDFKKLDRYIKKKVGKWKGKNLLTEKDLAIIETEKDPQVQTRTTLMNWLIHLALFVIVHVIFWYSFGKEGASLLDYLTDWSWFGEEDLSLAPFQNEAILNISRIWLIILTIDTVVSLLDILFPKSTQQKA